MSSSCCENDCQAPDSNVGYRRILWVALGINVSMFLVEIGASFIAGSASLPADALDFWQTYSTTLSRWRSSA